MKKLILILLNILLLQKVFAMEMKIWDLKLSDEGISFVLNISDLPGRRCYFTNLHKPGYKVQDDILYVYFRQIEIPDMVCMDFPEVEGDEIINNQVQLKNSILFDEMNYVPFEDFPNKIQSKLIKKIIFEVGYMDDYDKSIVAPEELNSLVQRDKFYYVVQRQKILVSEFCL